MSAQEKTLLTETKLLSPSFFCFISLSPPLPSSLPSPIPYHPSHIASTEKHSSSSYWRCSLQPQLAHHYYYHHRKKKKTTTRQEEEEHYHQQKTQSNVFWDPQNKLRRKNKQTEQTQCFCCCCCYTREREGGGKSNPQEKTELVLERKN